VYAEDRVVTVIRSVKMAGASFAFSTLTFFRNRREDFWRIHFIEFVKDE